jgi:hypothetical protein
MSNNDNYGHSSQYPMTDTNMFVGLIANSDKLRSESKRWNWDGEKNPELDDDHSNYINNNNNNSEHRHTDNNTDKEKERERTETDNKNSYNNDTAKREDSPKKPDGEESLSAEELMLRKLDMLRKLSELAQAGVKLSQNYNMNSDYKMMKYEYELHKGIRAKQNGINWMSSMSLNLIYGVEMLNDKYNPFDLKLKGWSEQMNADVNNYYDIFGELYEKYNQPGKNMAPELKLLLMVSGSALKFHLTNTMMSNLPTLNTQLDEDPVLAEQLRQKAIAQKIKEQSQKNNEALKTAISKEHEQANQKAQDLNLIRQKEIEFQNLRRENAQKTAELDALKEKLSFSNSKTQKNTQQNSQTSFPRPQVQTGGVLPNYTPQPPQHPPQQPQMNIPPMVQRMMMAKQQQQQQLQDQLNQQYGLANNSMVSNKIDTLKAQADYMEELEKIKKLRLEEEKRSKHQEKKKAKESSYESETSESASNSDSSKSTKSSVEYNVNLKTILSDSKKSLKENTSSEKITSLGLVDPDEVSRSNISLGKKRVKKDKESKDSQKSDKPKTVRQKKTGISLE